MNSWIICLEECLPDFGVNLDSEKIKELASILKENASCISDMEFERLGGKSSSTSTPDYKKLYEQMKHENENIVRENNIYRNSVARRRHVPVEDVRIEDDDVIYGTTF